MLQTLHYKIMCLDCLICVKNLHLLFKEQSPLLHTYFTEFRGLIDELDNLAPIPRCTCTNATCTCNNTQKLDKYEQMMKLSQFLMGLGDQYTNTRGQLLLMSPLPDLSQAYALLLQEENQRGFIGHTAINTDAMAMNVRSGSFSGNKIKSQPHANLIRNLLMPLLSVIIVLLLVILVINALHYMAIRSGIDSMVSQNQELGQLLSTSLQHMCPQPLLQKKGMSPVS